MHNSEKTKKKYFFFVVGKSKKKKKRTRGLIYVITFGAEIIYYSWQNGVT